MTTASIVLTIVLVAVTGYYAWQTKQTVSELRRARGAGLLPKIALSFQHPGGAVGFPVLANAGMGPAFDVDLTMSYQPAGPDVRWTRPFLPVGETHRFLAPERTAHMPDLISKWDRIVLKGACKDALGDTHPVEQTINLKEYWELNADAMHLIDTDHHKKAADELEKIRSVLERMKS